MSATVKAYILYRKGKLCASADDSKPTHVQNCCSATALHNISLRREQSLLFTQRTDFRREKTIRGLDSISAPVRSNSDSVDFACLYISPLRSTGPSSSLSPKHAYFLVQGVLQAHALLQSSLECSRCSLKHVVLRVAPKDTAKLTKFVT